MIQMSALNKQYILVHVIYAMPQGVIYTWTSSFTTIYVSVC